MKEIRTITFEHYRQTPVYIVEVNMFRCLAELSCYLSVAENKSDREQKYLVGKY